MERSTEGEGGLRVIWEEDEEGNVDSVPRLVRNNKGDKNKGAEALFPKIEDPDLAIQVKIEQELQDAAERKLAEARKAASEAADVKTRDLMKFGARLDDIPGGADQNLVLTNDKGAPLMRKALVGKTIVDKPATLADYLPELGKMKIHIRHQTEGTFTGVRLEKVGKENVLWVPARLTHDQVPALIPEIIRVVAETKLNKETEKVEAAKKVVQAKVKKLPDEHSTTHRIHGLHETEKKVVEAEAARERKLEEGVKAVLDRVKEEQHIDLAAPEGGTEHWLRKLKGRSDASVSPNEETGLTFGNEHHHHPEGSWAQLYTEAVPESIAADKKMVEAAYDQWQKDADALPDGPINSLLKSKARKALRGTAKTIEMAYQTPKHVVVKPAKYVGAFGIGIGSFLWKLTELPGFKGAKEQIAEWGKDLAGLVGLDGGGKKGGGGDHH